MHVRIYKLSLYLLHQGTVLQSTNVVYAVWFSQYLYSQLHRVFSVMGGPRGITILLCKVGLGQGNCFCLTAGKGIHQHRTADS